MPRFAMDGLVGSEGSIQKTIPQFAADAMASGMDNFSANVGVNASPTINNLTDVRISERALLKTMDGVIDAKVTSLVEREMVQKAKFHSKIIGRFR